MTIATDLAHRGSATYGTSPMALEDRFEILKDIGDGSFGSVVLARVRTAGAGVARRGTIVAIKTMKKTFESFTPCMELREVVFLRNLPQHPHLVPAYDIFLDPFSKKLHIAMEHMDGNLYQLMKAREHKVLDNGTVKSILYQIMLGLEHIHAHHFFHRDIKPENILVSALAADSPSLRRYSGLVTPPHAPASYTVKIADFGLARETHSKLPYTTYVSTRWYRAPEVLLRAGEYSAPVDIWAVGAMAVEIATLKPLFPGGNEVDQVWRVCEIMGSPGNWHSKSGARVGGGEWKDGTRLAGKLGFSFPKMAPHSMETILLSPQWPASLSHFVTWCLMWDPRNRPNSSQAIAHEYFADAVDPLRPKSSASRILGRKQSDLSYHLHKTAKDTAGSPTLPSASRPSWFRKSLIGRSEPSEPVPAGAAAIAVAMPAVAPVQLAAASTIQAPVHATTIILGQPHSQSQSQSQQSGTGQPMPVPGAKRTTWANGPSNVAPMLILPTIRPISPISDAVTAQANGAGAATVHYNDAYMNAASQRRGQDDKAAKKIGRQLSVNSSNHYADHHRAQAERALNGNSGLVSPPSAHKEGFFSHLRKRARRFSGRHQTPISPTNDVEAQVGCGPWGGSNRSSMVIDGHGQGQGQGHGQGHSNNNSNSTSNNTNMNSSTVAVGSPRADPYYETPSRVVAPPTSTPAVPPPHGPPYNSLKRHHSLPKQQARSIDNLIGAARAPGPVSSRTRRSQVTQGVQQYEAPAEEDELLDEVLSSTHQAMRQLNDAKPLLQHSASSAALPDPYPTPSPSANGTVLFFSSDGPPVSPKPLDLSSKTADMVEGHTWPTPPYEESEWAASASASIWAASHRF